MAHHYETVQQAIAAAGRVLPGRAAPDGAEDPRWQSIIAVGDFVETEPEAVWFFVERWGEFAGRRSPLGSRDRAVGASAGTSLRCLDWSRGNGGVEQRVLRRHRLQMLETR